MARLSEEAQAVGLSLWLVPEGETQRRLAALIDGLARRLATPSFAPHLTLLAGIGDAEEPTLARAAEVARGVAPLAIPLQGIGGSDDYFRCLFVRAGETDAVRSAHGRAIQRFAPAAITPFRPHVSLVYGRLAPAEREHLAAELAGSVPSDFPAARLDVMRTQGPPKEWRRLATLPLAG